MTRAIKPRIGSNVILLDGQRKPVRALPAMPRPTAVQREWLARGLNQPGGKLPLFDRNGRRVSERTVKSCLRQGWAEPWFDNPLKPDWLICKLTQAGRDALQG